MHKKNPSPPKPKTRRASPSITEQRPPTADGSLRNQAAELEAARKEAVNQQNRLRAIMEVLPVGMAILDEKGGAIDSNRAYEEVWGQPRPPAKSVEDYSLYKAWWMETGGPIRPEEWASAICLRTGEPVVGQLLKIQRFDGTYAYVINSAAPVRDAAGKVTACAVAIQDITQLHRVRQDLRKREDELQIVMDISPSLLAYIDRELRYRKANKEYERWFGLPVHSIEGRCVREVVGEQAWEMIQPYTERVLAGEVVSYEQEMPYASGGSRWVQTHSVPDKDEQGFVRGFVVNVTDITARKRMEEELRQSEEKNRAMIQHAPVGIYEISFRDRRFVSVNDAMCHHLGYTREELLRMDPFDILDEASKKVFQGRITNFLAHKAMPESVEYRVRAKDGRILYAVLNVTPVYREGRPVGMFVIAHDVTGRRRNEEERERLLAESTRRAAETEAILAAQNEAVVTYDASEFVVRANPSFCSLYGFDPVGMHMREVAVRAGVRTMQGVSVSWDNHPTIRALRNQEATDALFRVNRADGTEGIVRISSGPMPRGEKDYGAVAVWHDVTSIRKMESTLKEREGHFRLAVEHMDMVVWQCDKELRFTSVSRRYLGHAEAEFLGKTLADIIGRAAAEAGTELKRMVLEQGAGTRRTIAYPCGDGRQVFFDEQVQPTRNEDGEVTGLIGLGLDITEQVRAEQHLRRSEEGLKMMIKHSQEAMVLVDEGGQIEYVSDTAAAQLGFGEPELTGTYVDRFIDWSTRLDMVMRVNEFRKHVPSPGRATMRLRRKDGSWIWLDLQATVLNFGRRPEKYLVKFQVIQTGVR